MTMLIALASVKGSPGCTTAALALAAAWPARERLLLEADPGGGDLGPWLGLPQTPGLVGLAAAARHDHDHDGETAWDHAQQIADGLHVVIAPVGAEQATACLATLTGSVTGGLPGRESGVVIADCGRLDPGSPALRMAREADLTLLLVRPHVSELAHLAPRIAGLARAGLRLGLLLAPATRRVPPEPAYGAQEITATLDLPVHATIPADARAAGRLIASRGRLDTAIRRRPLLKAATAIATGLAGHGDAPLDQHPDSPPQDRNETPTAEVTAGDHH